MRKPNDGVIGILTQPQRDTMNIQVRLRQKVGGLFEELGLKRTKGSNKRRGRQLIRKRRIKGDTNGIYESENAQIGMPVESNIRDQGLEYGGHLLEVPVTQDKGGPHKEDEEPIKI